MVFFIPIAVAAMHVIVSFRIIKMIMVILSLGSNMVLFCMVYNIHGYSILYHICIGLCADC